MGKRGSLVCVTVSCLACGSTRPTPRTIDGIPGAAEVDAGIDFDGGTADLPKPSDASSPALDDLAPALDLLRLRGDLPALAGAVWRGRQLIGIGAAGLRKRGDPTAASEADLWHLGSNTKAMTATLIGLHVDRGTMRFEDTIGARFAGEDIHPAYVDVTLEQLLQHRGGTPGDIPSDILSDMWAGGPGARTKAVGSLIARPPAQTPGTFVYSNAGYMIAGVALERTLGVTWEEIMRNDLFTPLGMVSCGFAAPGTPDAITQPRGHRLQSGRITPVPPGPESDNPPSLGPAGTVHCSLRDWGKFLALHVAGTRREPTILSSQTMDRLHAPSPPDNYAGGWIRVNRSWAGGDAFTHSGSNAMWYATAWLAPAKNLAFAVVTNRGDERAGSVVDEAMGVLVEKYAP